MKLRNYLIAITLLLLPLNLQASTSITEQSVQDMIEQVDQATDARNVEGVTAYLASSAEIILDLPSNMGGRVELSAAEYKSMLAQAWSAPFENTHEVRDVNIKIASDGQSATVTHLTIETVSANGNVIMKSNTKTLLKLQMIDDAIKIIYVYGDVEIDSAQQA